MLIALVIAGSLLPAGPASSQADAGLVPFPSAGDVVVYDLAFGWQDDLNEGVSTVTFSGPTAALHRDGTERTTLTMDDVWDFGPTEQPGCRTFDDPWGYRFVTLVDLGTRERVETRTTDAFCFGWGLGEVGPLDGDLRDYENHFLQRILPDAGVREPLAVLWGASLDRETLAFHTVEGWGGRGLLGWWGDPPLQRHTGTYYPVAEPTYHDPGPFEEPLELHRVGEEVVAGVATVHYSGTEDRGEDARPDRITRDLWLAPGLALPVRDLEERHFGDDVLIRDRVLRDHTAGDEAGFPWGGAAGAQVFVPEMRPPRDGVPDDGRELLPYPLHQAVAAALQDPTLPTLAAMVRDGEPVLVMAAYERVDGLRIREPLPEIRWWLVFHDADANEAVVESKRVLGTAAIVNREHHQISPPWPRLTVDAIRPDELPAEMPTLAGAVRAWRAYGSPAEGEPNALTFGLHRTVDGEIVPTVWAGRVEWSEEGVPRVAGREARVDDLVEVDPDGMVRVAVGIATEETAGPLRSSAPASPPGPAAPGDAAALHPEAPTSAQGNGAPEAGSGMPGLLAGFALVATAGLAAGLAVVRRRGASRP